MNNWLLFLIAIIWLILYGGALIKAAEIHGLSVEQKHSIKRMFWKLLPYMLSVLPTIFRKGMEIEFNLVGQLPWFVFYLTLTWVLVYSIRKQYEQTAN